MFTTAVPEPALADVVVEPYEVDVPYSTCQLVASPPGTTDPVTVAVVDPIAVAGPVVAVGAAARALPPKLTSATAAATAAASAIRLPFISHPQIRRGREHDHKSCGFLRRWRKRPVKRVARSIN